MCVCLWVLLISTIIFQDSENQHRKLPSLLFDYKNVTHPKPKTRSTASDSCDCQICLVAEMKNAQYLKFRTEHFNPVGAPRIHPISPPAMCLIVCDRCFGVKTGPTHICVKSNKSQNIVKMVRQTSDKSKAKVVSATLKTICEEQGISTRGGRLQLQTGSKSLPVQVGTPKNHPKKARFSYNNLKRLQAQNNLSDRVLLWVFI